jgi:hypothetical protein
MPAATFNAQNIMKLTGMTPKTPAATAVAAESKRK